MSEGIAWPLRS